MLTPYFWAQRVADDDWRPITDFVSETDQTGGSATSPASGLSVSFSDLDPGDYVIAVSKGESGLKSSTRSIVKQDALGRSDLSPVLNTKVTFSEANPTLAGRAGGTLSDYAGSEVEEGALTADADGGGASVKRLYDQTGGADLTAPDQNEEPLIVQNGSLVTTANGDPAVEIGTQDRLSRSLPSSGPWTAALEVDADSDGTLATFDGAPLSRQNGDFVIEIEGELINTIQEQFVVLGETSSLAYNAFTVFEGTFVLSESDDIYTWDGNQWVSEASGFQSGGISDFFEMEGSLYGIEEGTIYERSGGSWSQVASSSETFRLALVVGSTAYLYASFTPAFGTFNGSSITVESTTLDTDAFISALAVTPDGSIYAGIYSDDTLSIEPGIFERTGANSWSRVVVTSDNVRRGKLAAATDQYLYTGTSGFLRVDVSAGTTTDLNSGDPGFLHQENERVYATGQQTTGLEVWTGGTSPEKTFFESDFPNFPSGNGLTIRDVKAEDGKLYLYHYDDGEDEGLWYGQEDKESVSVPSNSELIVQRDGDALTLRSGGQESSKTFSLPVPTTGEATIGQGTVPWRLRRAVAFDRTLSQSERSTLESVLNSQ